MRVLISLTATSDGDIINYSTAIVQCDGGGPLAFHTNFNVTDEQRRFCVIGTHEMIEGDFLRGNLKATTRDGRVVAADDYTQMESARASAHYGANYMMVDDIVAFLEDDIKRLPVGVLDAMEAGLVAMD